MVFLRIQREMRFLCLWGSLIRSDVKGFCNEWKKLRTHIRNVVKKTMKFKMESSLGNDKVEKDGQGVESVEAREKIDGVLLKKQARDMLYGACYEELGSSKVVELLIEAHGAKKLVSAEDLKGMDEGELEAARRNVLRAELELQQEGGYVLAEQLHALSPEERGNLFDEFTLQIETEKAYKALSKTRKSSGKESSEYEYAHARWMNLRAARKMEENAFSPRVREFYLEGKLGNIIPARKAYDHISRFVVIDRVFEDVKHVRHNEEQGTGERIFPEPSFGEHVAAVAEVDPAIAEREVREKVFQLHEAVTDGNREETHVVMGEISAAADVLDTVPKSAALGETQETIRREMLVGVGEVVLSKHNKETLPPVVDAHFLENILQAIDHDEVIRQGELAKSMKRVLANKETEAPPVPAEVTEKLEHVVRAASEALPAKERKTGIISRMRGFAKRHLMVLSAASVLSFLAAKKMDADITEPARYPKLAVELLEKVPYVPKIPLFEKAVAIESSHYRTGPTLRAVTVGVDDYMEHLTRNAIEAAGFKGVAAGMFERDLYTYMSTYDDLSHKNRYTSINEHTIELYMRGFVENYFATSEEGEQQKQLHGRFVSFLQEKAGLQKAHELNRMILEKHGYNFSDPFMADMFEEIAKTEKFLEMAKGKCNIFFNEEDGTMQVIYGNTLIDTYSSRAGFLEVPDDPDGELQKLGYSRLPDGIHKIGDIKQNYTTLRWREAAVPYGAKLRHTENGQVEYERSGEWLRATGPDAVFFDRDKKIEPNKTNGGGTYWTARTKGEPILEKADFESDPGILLDYWDKNPFGEVTVLLAGRGEAIHANPTKGDFLLTPSHGCFRLTVENIKKVVQWIRPGARMEIVSETGKTWKDSILAKALTQKLAAKKISKK